VAARIYALCNSHAAVSRAIPYLLGGYYAVFHYSRDTCHMAQYYDVTLGRVLWISGRNLSGGARPPFRFPRP
jgi:hypothetical protein